MESWWCIRDLLNRNQSRLSGVGCCIRPQQSCSRTRGQRTGGCLFGAAHFTPKQFFSWALLSSEIRNYTTWPASFLAATKSCRQQPSKIIHKHAPVKPSESKQRRTQHRITGFISFPGFPFLSLLCFFFFFFQPEPGGKYQETSLCSYIAGTERKTQEVVEKDGTVAFKMHCLCCCL